MSLSPFQTFQGRASSWERSPGKQETNHEDVRSAVWLFDIDISSLLEVAVNLIMNRGSCGPLLHILGALSCAALGLSLPSFLQLALVLSNYSKFGFRFILVCLQVSHVQPVPDVCVRLLVLPLLHVEPDLVQPDELEVQEGLQDHPALCSSAKPKGGETIFLVFFNPSKTVL